MPEWTEWHLTPSGWERGSYRSEIEGLVEIDTPNNRVLTVKYSEFMSASLVVEKNLVWECSEKEKIKELTQKFGLAPNSL